MGHLGSQAITKKIFQKISQLRAVARCENAGVRAGPSSLGVPGVPWHTQILADQLTLFQPGGTDYAHLTTTGTPRFSDLPTALEVAEAANIKS